MALNVNRKVDDLFYRYKMPKLQAKVEGKGNGIKTVITNMVDIAKSLERPPAYPTKFFGIVLGAQTQMDEKKERYIVNGAHSGDDLQDILDGFISKFVLCPACENPETSYEIGKKKITQKCAACGYSGFLPTHRLTTYIMNHPPSSDLRVTKPSKTGKKKGTRKSEDDDEIDASPVDVDEFEDNDNEDWAVDTSAQAVREREDNLTGAAAKLVMAEDAGLDINERLDLFHQYVEEKKNEEKFPAKEVLAKAERLDCKEKGIMIICQALLNHDDLIDRIKLHHPLLQRFTDESPKSQKYLLHALEVIFGDHPELIAQVATIFNALYVLDIVEEDSFLSWNEKVSKKYVSKDISQQIHDAAKPFLQWLQEASEDEDEDDDEAEDEEVQFDDAVKGVSSEIIKPAAPVDDDDDDDDDGLDIDDI